MQSRSALRSSKILLTLLGVGGVAFADEESPAAGERGGPGLALRAAKILTAARAGPQVIDHGVLLIRDGKIEAVGRASDVAVPAGYQLVDVGSRWLMPGIIELHCHVGNENFFSENTVNDTVYLANPGIRASSNVRTGNRLLRNGVAGGVTTALHIPGSGSNIGGHGVLFKLGLEKYEEALVRDPGSLKLAQAGNPESWTVGVGRSFMNWNIRNTFVRGLAYAKRWEAFEAGGGPKPDLDPQFEIFRALRAKRAQVSTHTQMFQVVLTTITMVKLELGLDVFIDHGSFGGYLAGGVAEEAGVPAILGPRTVAYTNQRQRGIFDGLDTDGKTIGMAAGYQERGHTRIGFNTDCVDGGETNFTPPQEELSIQAAYALRYGMTNRKLESIRGLTIIPAETVGLGDRIGSLEPGKDADVVVVTGDLADPRTYVERVYTDGRMVYDHEADERRW